MIKRSLILFSKKRTEEILKEFAEFPRTVGKTMMRCEYFEKKLLLDPQKEFNDYLCFLIKHYRKINKWRKKHTRKFKKIKE